MRVCRHGRARESAPAWTGVPGAGYVCTHRAVLGGSARVSVRVLTRVRWCLRGCQGSSDRVYWIPGGFRRRKPKPLSRAQPLACRPPAAGRPCCSYTLPAPTRTPCGCFRTVGFTLAKIWIVCFTISSSDLYWPLTSQAQVPKTSDSHHLQRAAALATVTKDSTQGAMRRPGPPPLTNWLLKDWGGPEGEWGVGWGPRSGECCACVVEDWSEAVGLAPELAWRALNGVSITMPFPVP